MRLKIRRVLLITSLLLLLLLGGSSAYVYFNQQIIIERVIGELNKQLKASVAIEAVELSFAKFPKAAVRLKNVYCAGAFGQEGDTLLYAQDLYLGFDLWNALSDPIVIDQLSLEKGKLHLHRRADGLWNYDILQASEDPDNTTIDLQQFDLSEMQMRYLDEVADLRAKWVSQKLRINGHFSADQLEGESEIVAYLDYVGNSAGNWAQKIALEQRGVVSWLNSHFSLRSQEAKLDGFEVDLSLEYDSTASDIRLQAQALALAELVPSIERQNLFEFPPELHKYSGQTELEYVYQQKNGRLLKHNLKAKAKSVGAYYRKKSWEKIDFDFEMNFPENAGISLWVKNIHIPAKSGALKGEMRIANLSKPQLDGSLSSDLSLGEWVDLLQLNQDLKASGQAQLQGKFSIPMDPKNGIGIRELKAAKLEGFLSVDKGEILLVNQNTPYRDITGKISLEGGSVSLQNLKFKLDKSDFYIDGSLRNLLPWLWFPGEELFVDGRLQSQFIDLDKIMAMNPSSSNKDGGDTSLFNQVRMQLILDILELRKGAFGAREINGYFQSDADNLAARYLSLLCANGRFKGGVELHKQGNTFLGQAQLSASGVDIQSFFANFDNFGQGVLKAENLAGKADIELTAKAQLSLDFDIDLNSLLADAAVRIENGRLIDFKPLEALSDYASIEELKDVRFATLQNNIHIENRRINLPYMQLENNALNLGLKGSHSFDNAIDYSIRLKLSDVLFAKRSAKTKKGEFDDFLIEEKRQEDPYIYISMTGTVDKPIIGLDKTALKKSIAEDLKKEGDFFKQLFKPKPEPAKTGSGIQYTWPEEDDG